jgi:putative MATE family efflux protein
LTSAVASLERRSQRILTGPLGVELARFGTPLALGMGLQTTFNLVDAYLLSRLDPTLAGPALGAIGICDQLAALGTILSYGLSVATSAIVTRLQGKGDFAGVKRVAWQSLLLVLALGTVYGALSFYGAEFLIVDVVGAKGEVANLSVRYFRLIGGGSFTIFLLLHLTTLQRALGSSKTPVAILLGANVLNLLLAVLLIYGPGEAPAAFGWGPAFANALHLPRLELMGAAWATLLARGVMLIPLLCLVTYRLGLFDRPSRGAPDRGIIGNIISLGWPSSAQLVVRILAMLLTHSLVARAYTTAEDQSATVALGIVFRLETMALFVGLGWGSAAQTFVGQNLGAGKLERAKASGYYAAVFNAVMMALLALMYRSFGGEIARFFDDDPKIISLALEYFNLVGWSYLGLGVGIALGSAIQGAGSTRYALVLDLAVVFGIQLPLSLAAVNVSQASPTSLFLVVALTYIAFAIVHLFAYRRGRFLKTAVT